MTMLGVSCYVPSNCPSAGKEDSLCPWTSMNREELSLKLIHGENLCGLVKFLMGIDMVNLIKLVEEVRSKYLGFLSWP